MIAVIVIGSASAGLGGWILLDRGATPQHSSTGTTTGLAALAMVDANLPGTASRAWTLFSDIGIASPGPFTPWVLGNFSSSANALATIWACGLLPLTTVWNVSGLPSRSGNVSDGYAPFWQFMFVNQSSSGQLVFAIGSYSQGQVRVVGPLSQSNACIEDLGLGAGRPWPGTNQPNLETSVGGPLAFAHASWDFQPGFSPYSLLWLDGPPLIANTGWDSFYGGAGVAWQASYYNCGVAGRVPAPNTYNSYHVSVWSQDGTPMAAGPIGVEFNCTLPSYELVGAAQPAGANQASSRPAVGVTVSAAPQQSVDAQGLAAWMILLELTDRNGTAIAPASDQCTAWVGNLSSCPTPTAGWYGVLLSPSGRWLDSYGTINGSARWSDLNVPILTNETVALLSAPSLGDSGSNLRFVPQVDWPEIVTSPVPL